MIINSQLGGKKPTGTKSITTNGTHDVAGYANADVQVPTTAPEIYRVFRNNNGKLENSITTPFLPLPNTITDIGEYCLARAYYNTPSAVLSGNIDLSSLTQISGQYACQSMFNNCKGITNVNLSGLTTIVGSNACQAMFRDCTGITSVDLSSLTSIYGANASYSAAQMFYGCTGLTSVDLSSLEEIKNNNGCENMFYGCTHLSTVNLSKLKTITGMMACQTMFRNCTSLTSLSFPALTSSSFGTTWTNQFSNMLQGVTGCTLHFPSNTQAKIETLTGYPNFAGTNTTVLFDLPATE